jgi:hypothetical protein
VSLRRVSLRHVDEAKDDRLPDVRIAGPKRRKHTREHSLQPRLEIRGTEQPHNHRQAADGRLEDFARLGEHLAIRFI